MENKNALVTGGLRGIGHAIGLEYARNGFDIILWDVMDEGKDESIDLLKKAGAGEVFFNKVNVADLAQVSSAIDEIISKQGKLDVLINNAGITKDNLLISMTEDEFDRVISVNLKGTFNCSKSAVKHMIKRRSGSIINISSVIGIMGNKGQSNYAASKAGIIGFTKSLAKEVGSRNVTVNAVAPGFIETEMTKKLPPEVIAEYAKLIPLGRMGSVEDVAKVCFFLSSENANYITGQVIHCDGGMLM